MAEPHELEDRARLELERIFAPAIDARAPYAKFMFAAGVSAVLALVKAEQEKANLSTATKLDVAIWWGEQWLSHTAPQEK
jgi:hypothetical protein